LKVKTKD